MSARGMSGGAQPHGRSQAPAKVGDGSGKPSLLTSQVRLALEGDVSTHSFTYSLAVSHSLGQVLVSAEWALVFV